MYCAPIAQLDRASLCGSEGRRFNSCLVQVDTNTILGIVLSLSKIFKVSPISMIKTAFELKTIGKLLAQKRQDKNLSFNQISEIIKINPEYLEALEKGDYARFPSEVYIKGFLKNYSRFLGIDPEHSLALYRREREKLFIKPKLRVAEKIRPKNIDLSITKNRIISIFAVLFALLTIVYIGSYVADIFQAPRLALSKPLALSAGETGEFESKEDSIQIEGLSEIGSLLRINGQEYRVNSFEQFVVTLQLEEGLNEVNITSENQFGAKTEINLNITYKIGTGIPPTPTSAVIENINNSINMRAEVIAVGAYLEIEVDGELVASKTYPVSEIIEFQAKNELIIFAPRPESINLFINGKKETINSSRIKYVLNEEGLSKINQ